MSVLFFRKERHALNGTLACLELILERGAENGLLLENDGDIGNFKGAEDP